MRIFYIFVALISIVGILFFFDPLLAKKQKVSEGQDHPLLSRFPGAIIVRQSSMEFDALLIPLGKATGINEFETSTRAEGKITRLTYEMPEGHSTLEVFRSYQQALVKNGFEVLFSCSMSECGPHLNFQKLERPFIIAQDHRYLAAKGTLPQGEVYVTVRVYTTARQNPPVRAMIGIAETQPMEEKLITVNATAMAEAIKSSGHIAVYGIYFDTDKADIKPGSETTLEEMAKFLKENPQLKVYIVGHTDNVGNLSYNLELSQRRAEAVVQALVARYNVGVQRLVPKGVGPFSPIISNKTEAGRSKNRRVELVEQ